MREASPNSQSASSHSAMRQALFLLTLVTCSSIESFAAAPVVVRVQPAAAIPGKETALQLFGENLGGPARLWTSFPCDGSLERDGEAIAFTLKIPQDATAGIGAIRLVTTNGMSGLQLFLFDPVATVTASTTNRSLASAQPLTRNTAADGVCEELQSAF